MTPLGVMLVEATYCEIFTTYEVPEPETILVPAATLVPLMNTPVTKSVDEDPSVKTVPAIEEPVTPAAGFATVAVYPVVIGRLLVAVTVPTVADFVNGFCEGLYRIVYDPAEAGLMLVAAIVLDTRGYPDAAESVIVPLVIATFAMMFV